MQEGAEVVLVAVAPPRGCREGAKRAPPRGRRQEDAMRAPRGRQEGAKRAPSARGQCRPSRPSTRRAAWGRLPEGSARRPARGPACGARCACRCARGAPGPAQQQCMLRAMHMHMPCRCHTCAMQVPCRCHAQACSACASAMNGSTSPCVPTIRMATLSGGRGTADRWSEPSQSSCCRRRRLSCRVRLATLDELMRDAGRGLLSDCLDAAPRSSAFSVAFSAASIANPTRRSLGVAARPPWRTHEWSQVVSSLPSSKLAKAGLRQVPEGRLEGVLGEFCLALSSGRALIFLTSNGGKCSPPASSTGYPPQRQASLLEPSTRKKEPVRLVHHRVAEGGKGAADTRKKG